MENILQLMEASILSAGSMHPDKMLVLLLAILLDFLVGEPKMMVHPTVWFGKLISFADRIYVRRGKYIDFLAGAVSSLAIILFALFLSFIPELIPLTPLIPLGFLLSVYLTKTTFAIKGLEEHIKRTVVTDLEEQRSQTAMIVSRDVSKLERHELCSASIESLSENLVDSVISPMFYFILFGLPGAMVYRAVNTMDAMIGYRTGKYVYFGKFIARLDDLLNYIPARIAFCLFLPLSPRRVAAYYKLARFKINGDKPVACMSAVLGVNLEKKGVYSFPGRKAGLKDVLRSVRVFRIILAEWLLVVFAALFLVESSLI
jgi:adenosylcobinamide-phosphate synthase